MCINTLQSWQLYQCHNQGNQFVHRMQCSHPKWIDLTLLDRILSCNIMVWSIFQIWNTKLQPKPKQLPQKIAYTLVPQSLINTE